MLEPRALGKLVLQQDWTIKGAVALVEFPMDISLAIDEYEYAGRPLIEIEPKLDVNLEGSFAAELRKWLKPIGMANWPEAKWDRAEWLNATVLSLSDLPPKAAISATKQTVHRDFSFPNEVKPAIRELAATIVERQRLALHRLKLMRAEIERAACPPTPQIEEQPMVWDQASVDAANSAFARVGADTRYRLAGTDVEGYSISKRDVDTGEDRADMGDPNIGKAPK